MTYVCYYHATADRVEAVLTPMGIARFVAQEPYARVLSWIPLSADEVRDFQTLNNDVTVVLPQ